MKKLLFFCIGFLILHQSLNAQQITQMERDTIENQIRNQFANVMTTASGDHDAYRAYFKNDATVKTESSMYNNAGKVDSICKPALAAYRNDRIQVVENKVDVRFTNYCLQSIKIITIDTDTSHGVPIPYHSPSPKHMELQIEWIQENDNWLIRNINRYLRR